MFKSELPVGKVYSNCAFPGAGHLVRVEPDSTLATYRPESKNRNMPAAWVPLDSPYADRYEFEIMENREMDWYEIKTPENLELEMKAINARRRKAELMAEKFRKTGTI